MKMNIPIELNVLETILFSDIDEELVFTIIKKNRKDCCLKTISEWRLDHKIPNDKHAKLHLLLLNMASRKLISLNVYDTTVTRKGRLYSIYIAKGLLFWTFVIGSILAIAGIVVTIIYA